MKGRKVELLEGGKVDSLKVERWKMGNAESLMVKDGKV